MQLNSRENLFALLVLCLVLGLSASALWPDLANSRVDLNDNVSHFAMIERIVQTVEHGGNPLDTWSPEWVFGFPMLRVYQPLAHLLVAGVYFALGKTVALMTVFVWVRFFAVLLLPLSFFATALLLELGLPAALAAAVFAPLVASGDLYGIEVNSYVWAGHGLFPQSVAVHLMLLSIGFGARAIRRGKGIILAGVLLGLTALAHLIFGYMGALSLCLLVLMPDPETQRGERLVRLVRMGAAAAVLAAFQLLPLLIDGKILNHSVWEPAWKWDSIGLGAVLNTVLSGKVLDSDRIPVLSLFAYVGAFWAFRKGKVTERFAVYGAGLWLLMLIGRRAWGPLLSMLGVSADMQLHRVGSGAQIFLVLLAGVAVGELYRRLSARKLGIVTAAIVLVLIAPAIQERSAYLANNEKWGKENLDAYASAAPALNATLNLVKERGGRVYTGVPSGWGGQHKIGSVPFFAFLSVRQIPAVAFLYHSMALPADIQSRMDEWNPVHYRLFGIRTVVAPAGIQTPLPPFWTRDQTIGRFDVFRTPETGYFDLVDAAAAVHTTKYNFYDVNYAWLQTDWPAKRLHLLLDLGGPVRDNMRVWPEERLMALPAFPSTGTVSNEKDGDDYQADIETTRELYALFKMTWHPNWKAWVDNAPVETAMLSPGFIGVPVTAGKHHVVLRYVGSAWKIWMALAGIGLVGLMAAAPNVTWRPVRVRVPVWVRQAAIVVLIALPAAIPMVTNRMAKGDDSLGYLPRQVEFHENIVHGTLLPRWAPDLDHGNGQPTFIFVPPLLHYVAEMWHVLGPELQTSINLATASLIVLFAWAMFLLCRLYFGELGGYLGAAAVTYAPYMALDLYRRAALSEYSAFPFCALALYGFAVFAKEGRKRYLALGSVAYAAVAISHFLVAFYFTPLLIGFLFLIRTRERWLGLIAGFLLGIGLSAWMWMPILIEGQYVQLERTMAGSFSYTQHFLSLTELLGLVPAYGGSKWYGLGLGHLVLAIVVWVRPGERRALKFFTAGVAAFCVMVLAQSGLIWDLFTVLRRIQFPWRLLGMASICMAMVVAAAGPLIARMKRARWAAFAGAMTLIVLPNLHSLAPLTFVEMDAHLWTPRYLANSGFETTTSGEFMPRWMTTLPPYRPLKSYDQHLKEPTTVELPIAYFPGWEVRANGIAVPIFPSDGYGLIRFKLPAGDFRVDAEFRRTVPRWAGEMLSFLSLLMLGWVVRRVPAAQPIAPKLGNRAKA